MSQQDSSRNRLLASLSTAGLVLFVIGFAVFLGSVAASDYRLSDEVFERLTKSGAIQGHHQETLFAELGALKDRDYSSVFTFLDDVERKLRETNERLDGGSQIWDYDRGQYKLAIAREAATGWVSTRTTLVFLLSIVLAAVGALLYFLPRLGMEPPGIKNNGVMTSPAKSRGAIGLAVGVFLIGFYVVLYFFPAYITGWIRLGDPISQALRGQPADRWFFYGLLYTFAVLVMGVRMAINYRHSRYQLVRTASVSFFQLGFAFLIPAILTALNKPSLAYDLKSAWPLDYSFFFDYRIKGYTEGGTLGWAMLVWGIALALLGVPFFSFLWGKRWYCSWVCGCGGLAETLGDPFRHLSDKRLKAWRAERFIVHGVLVFAVVMTAIVLVDFARGGSLKILGLQSWQVRSWYGFLIGSIFAGVVGTGFYPLMGNRVWCRFGCPLAAILGLVQRFRSRFRITTNGGQCISCGNCSTYCEMGIDVRWYAQRGQNVVRSSCVGCGICSQVCPRGVLRLENGPTGGRFDVVDLVDLSKGRIEVG